MAYITEQQLKDAFGQFVIEQMADRDNDADPVKMSAAIATAIQTADAEIDAYLAPVYPLPLATTPATIARISLDVTRYHLSSVNPTDDVRAKYKDATDLLTKLSKSIIELDIPKEGENAAVDGPERIFSRENLGNF